MSTETPRPPAPTADLDSAVYWDGVAAGELRIQRCTSCAALRHPPGPMCPRCGSMTWDSVVAAGTGTVFSAIVPRSPEFPGFRYPYVVALVELSEGVRIVANLREVGDGGATIGEPVELFFEDHGDFKLPQFRPVSRG